MNAILMNSTNVMTILDGVRDTLSAYGSVIITIIGVVMVIVGLFQVGKNLISHGKAQTNWFITIALILIGGIFALTGGWKFVGGIVKSAKGTADDLANGTAATVEDDSQANGWE